MTEELNENIEQPFEVQGVYAHMADVNGQSCLFTTIKTQSLPPVAELIEMGAIIEPYLYFDDGILCEDDPNGVFGEFFEFDNPTNPTKVVVNMQKARNFILAQIRKQRDQRLTLLDSLVITALSKQDQDEVDRLNAIKDQLRTLPEDINIDAIETPLELVRLRPSILWSE